MKRFFSAIGSLVRTTTTAVVAVAILSIAIPQAANYTLTQGVGTTFGSIVVTGVNYAQQLLCDSVAPSQCASVDTFGSVKVAPVGLVDGVSITSQTGSMVGCLAQTTPAGVSTGTLAFMGCDPDTRALYNLPYTAKANFLAGLITTAMTGTTSTALTGMGAQGSSVRVYVTACTFSNTHASVGTEIVLQDGSGGTTLWTAPAGSLFGGAQVVFPTPIKTTANTGLFAQNLTTGASTKVSCTGFKGA